MFRKIGVRAASRAPDGLVTLAILGHGVTDERAILKIDEVRVSRLEAVPK
jgi:hypothetical protein